jgi:hypothetical protein
MSILLCFLIIIASFCEVLGSSSALMSDSGLDPPMRVSIETPEQRRQFRKGEPITITVSVENLTNEPLHLLVSCDALDYKLTVEGEGGYSPPLTAFGRKVTDPLVMHYCARRSRSLNPGEPRRVTLPLSDIYDLSRSGKYVITVNRFARKLDGTRILAVSKQLNLIVN